MKFWDFVEYSKKSITQLSINHRLLFGYIVNQRTLPNYLFFEKNENLDAGYLLKKALDFCYESCFEQSWDKPKSQSLLEQINEIAFSHNDYETFYSWIATFSYSAVDELLDFIESEDIESIMNVSMVSLDSVDCFLQEKFSEEGVFSNEILLSKEEEEKREFLLENAPLMQAEIHFQKKVLDSLSKMKVMDKAKVTDFLQSLPLKSNIDIGLLKYHRDGQLDFL